MVHYHVPAKNKKCVDCFSTNDVFHVYEGGYEYPICKKCIIKDIKQGMYEDTEIPKVIMETGIEPHEL